MTHPDVLLLDEPTNHLDLAGIVWLEELLNEGSFACVLVSHDRYFLENVATEIVELNRVYADGLLRVKGSYSKFIEGKQAYHGGAEQAAGCAEEPRKDRGRVAAPRTEGESNEGQGADRQRARSDWTVEGRELTRADIDAQGSISRRPTGRRSGWWSWRMSALRSVIGRSLKD